MKQVEPMPLAALRLANHGQHADNRLNTNDRRFDRHSGHKD